MKRKIFILIICILMLIIIGFFYNELFMTKDFYTNEDFNIKTIISDVDYDQDGIDDYTDILTGAREYLLTKPKYISSYYEGGYPPSGEGVCTDVIWYALKNAGYDLKELVDYDIKNNRKEYPLIKLFDSNIAFRRVTNLKVFFDRHLNILSTNLNDYDTWQPGDIVTFEGHIGIVSDKRKKDKEPYIYHLSKPETYTLDEMHHKKYQITGHYRFKIDLNDFKK